MTSGLASPAAARPSHASHMSGSYSVARLKASAAYATSRSVSSPSIGMPSESTPASNTRWASLVPFIGGDLSPHCAAGARLDHSDPTRMCGRYAQFAHYFRCARHRTDARDCTKFEGRHMLPFVESVTTAHPQGGRMTQPVQSHSGTISVLTTERGLPVRLRLDAVELKKPPEQLARDIL